MNMAARRSSYLTRSPRRRIARASEIRPPPVTATALETASIRMAHRRNTEQVCYSLPVLGGLAGGRGVSPHFSQGFEPQRLRVHREDRKFQTSLVTSIAECDRMARVISVASLFLKHTNSVSLCLRGEKCGLDSRERPPDSLPIPTRRLYSASVQYNAMHHPL